MIGLSSYTILHIANTSEENKELAQYGCLQCVSFDMFYKHFLLTTFCSFKHIEPIRMNIKTNQNKSLDTMFPRESTI